MKLVVFGASGSGTTTLGSEIAKRTNFVHLDVDDFYWENTQPPFQQKRPLNERNRNLKADFKKHENVIVSGSLISWGKEWETSFDLAIFVRMNNSDRMERLKQREIQRYGEKLVTDKIVQRSSESFLKWASQYEDPNFDGRSLKIHNEWIERLDCQVLRLDGRLELNDKTEKVLAEIETSDIAQSS